MSPVKQRTLKSLYIVNQCIFNSLLTHLPVSLVQVHLVLVLLTLQFQSQDLDYNLSNEHL